MFSLSPSGGAPPSSTPAPTPIPLVPWYYDCRRVPNDTVDTVKGGVQHKQLVPIGHNEALFTYGLTDKEDRRRCTQHWCIMSLSQDGSLSSLPIDAPPGSSGIVNMQIVRVADSVIAYGGYIQPQQFGLSHNVPSHAMFTYSIDTREWAEVVCEGEVPQPRLAPLVFPFKNSLVLMGGYMYPKEGERGTEPRKDMWQWCGERERGAWTRIGEMPPGLKASGLVGVETQDALLFCNYQVDGTVTYKYTPHNQHWEGPLPLRHLSNGEMVEGQKMYEPYRFCALSDKKLLYMSKDRYKSNLRLWLYNTVAGECVQCEGVPGLVAGSTATCLINPTTLLILGDDKLNGRYRCKDTSWLVELD
ncbi:hypothetical protein KIPB_001587 [Kipferlia bialata]|uniref:Uncharacterized protein n=1 Tax=Kipferlia bialata TaxID=797122 RepID=A0A9K3GFM6_9EUKA|nr:hypothetical protein KIPB_001587 [Kipferlia bialata]|eukprot:g1587.t1